MLALVGIYLPLHLFQALRNLHLKLLIQDLELLVIDNRLLFLRLLHLGKTVFELVHESSGSLVLGHHMLKVVRASYVSPD